MARKPSPWYWPERHGWFTIIDSRRHRLLDLPAEAPPPKKRNGRWIIPPEVDQIFHRLMASRIDDEPLERASLASPIDDEPLERASLDSPLVAEILDKYLAWCLIHRAQRTYDWYRDHLQNFLRFLPAAGTLKVAALKPFHIVEWVDQHPGWSNIYKRGAIVAIQRPFNWAENQGYITTSPVKKIEKPEPQRRDNPMPPEVFAAYLSLVKENDPFRDLLQFAWHSGCRPQEARHIEARHVHLDAQCIIIPKEEAKGKKRPRVIHLEGPAFHIVKRLVRGRAQGKLFLNADGRPWKKFAVCNRFDRLRLKLAVQELRKAGIPIEPLPRFNHRAFKTKAELAAARIEHQKKLRDRRKQINKLARERGKGYACYDLRHGFCERLLEGGTDHLTVAELLGHADGRMVATTYQHLGKAHGYLKDALKKAAAGGAA
jgi:integrase